ncbi:hypothetical protein JEQ12_017592 [Ovis aries]|uniref:Uncharacterized protein n=1 Tax=Ovis aries TaxID=9940 RepID=A0A836D2E4_SHEEP|nr:hypothetical protein JEQ12_017592 [Ovis aries]
MSAASHHYPECVAFLLLTFSILVSSLAPVGNYICECESRGREELAVRTEMSAAFSGYMQQEPPVVIAMKAYRETRVSQPSL